MKCTHHILLQIIIMKPRLSFSLSLSLFGHIQYHDHQENIDMYQIIYSSHKLFLDMKEEEEEEKLLYIVEPKKNKRPLQHTLSIGVSKEIKADNVMVSFFLACLSLCCLCFIYIPRDSCIYILWLWCLHIVCVFVCVFVCFTPYIYIYIY